MKKIIASVWKIFKNTPLGKLIRFLAPQWLVNLLEHFPIAILANIIYGFPSQKLTVIGVTGTDGKTTTVNMIYKILKDAGKKVSMVSTVNAVVGDRYYDTGFHVTSPHSFIIQEFLKKALDQGSEYMVLEVTSHALDQNRFWGVKFDIGVITNITHEHLDYHKTLENYLLVKAKLIKGIKVAVLNADEKHFTKLSSLTPGRCKIVSFGLKNKADFSPKKYPLKLKVPGNFNILNGLTALAVCQSLGVNEAVAKKSLESFMGIEGRMEEIKSKSGIKVIIDFAHTPNGLENALKTLKKQTKGKLISVFGAASKRDVEKRPMMGEISGKLADVTVLTDEDPRFEDSMKIINEIAVGAYEVGLKDGVNIFKEPDRFKAIKLAISLAKKGDIVGIFGKGHEKSMNYKGKEISWSDKQAVLKVLNG